MKNRPLQQNSQALRFLHYSLHYEQLMQQLSILPGYDPSSEMDPKSHTIIIVPSGWRGSAYLYGSLSSVNSRCAPDGGAHPIDSIGGEGYLSPCSGRISIRLIIQDGSMPRK
ncbi:hypothetical protein AVEN_121185-1 [Araneus ventricosus]|uniref:Uncharacterized protein n=1 Tax=Araneus ventricosus TaxID=182803 RepID=A0A4Y2KD99_ARAVE|nr:hypothetical protein AVEN_121185-1 [Araneus ventricosus]